MFVKRVTLILVAFAVFANVDLSVDKLIASPRLGDSAQATITSISPSQGPIAGGTEVTLTGSGFGGTTLTLELGSGLGEFAFSVSVFPALLGEGAKP